MKYSEYFPFINDFVSLRLAESVVQFRNLKKRVGTTIDLNGSAYQLIREIDGTNSVNAIISRLCSTFTGIDPITIRQDYTETLDHLLREGVVSFSKLPINKKMEGLQIIAPEIRGSIHFDITHKCNEHCIHCLVDKDDAQASTDDIIDVLCQSAELGYTSLSFSGGEPSIHPDFFEILKTSRDLGFYFTIFSNVIGLTEKDIAKLSSLYPEKVRISLYSMNPEVHDQITQVSGSHEQTMNGIMMLKDAGVRLFINIPVTNRNYNGYKDVANFCDNSGFERNIDPVVQPTRDLRDRNMELQLDYQQAKEVTGFQQAADVLVANVKDGNVVCNAGFDPSIDANLNVYPCPGIRKPLGSLKKSTLTDLVVNSPFIEELQGISLEVLGLCQTCEYLNGCYRCHGHAYQDENNFYGCSWYDKRQAKIRQELMIERRGK